MRRRIQTLMIAFALVAGMVMYPLPVQAAGGIGSTIKETFPDVVLAKAIANELGTDVDHTITQGDIDKIEKLQIVGESIGNTAGLEVLTNLKSLGLNGNEITSIDNLSSLTKLEYLEIAYNKLTAFPSGIEKLVNLKELYLHSNDIKGGIPSGIGALTKLEKLNLNLNRNLGGDVPAEIGQLTNLKMLNLTNTGVTSLPDTIGNLTNLEMFYCYNNNLEQLPKEIVNLKKLTTLTLGYNKLVDLSKEQYDFILGVRDSDWQVRLICQTNIQMEPVIKSPVGKALSYEGFAIYKQSENFKNFGTRHFYLIQAEPATEEPSQDIWKNDEKEVFPQIVVEQGKTIITIGAEQIKDLPAGKYYAAMLVWGGDPKGEGQWDTYAHRIELVPTPPEPPTISTTTPGALTVSGRAQPGVTVTIRDSAGNVLGQGPASADGSYTVNLNRAAVGGETLFARATNAHGLESNKENDGMTTVLATPVWEKPLSLTVDPVTSSAVTVTGTTSPGAEVAIWDADGKVVLGKGSANADGSYTITLNRPAVSGEWLRVKVRMEGGVEKEERIQVSGSSTPPIVIPPAEDKPVRPPVISRPGGGIASGGYDFGYGWKTVSRPESVVAVPTPVKKAELIAYEFTLGSYFYEDLVNHQRVKRHEMDVMPVVESQRTLLPLRYVANALGIQVEYDTRTRIATFTDGTTVVTLNIDSDTLYKNAEPYKMDARPLNINSRILVSVANVAYAFGMTSGSVGDGVYNDIEWDKFHQTATIYPKLEEARGDQEALRYHVEK